jgi:hypothetical protein
MSFNEFLAKFPFGKADTLEPGMPSLEELVKTHHNWRQLLFHPCDPTNKSAIADPILNASIRVLGAGFGAFESKSFLLNGNALLRGSEGFSLSITRVTTLDGVNYLALCQIGTYNGFLVISGNVPTVLGIYIPAARLIISEPQCERHLRGAVAYFDSMLISNPSASIRHMLRPFKGLNAVIANQHIGHHLWDELSGLTALIKVVGIEAIERLVVRPVRTEIYLPLDQIYPYLSGRVERPDSMRVFGLSILEGSANVVPLLGRHIPADLCEIILHKSRAAASTLLNRLERLKGPSSTLRIAIGLRVENRCWIRQEEGYLELTRKLLEQYPQIVVIVDGHNSHHKENNGYFKSYSESLSISGVENKPSTVQEEERIFAFLREHFTKLGLDERVKLISTIGMPVYNSIAATDWCDLFLSHWGAGLAKYKWICNKPGIIITNNVMSSGEYYKSKDLLIYDDPKLRKGQIPSTFVDSGLITDLVYPQGQIVPVNQPSSSSFDCDPVAFADSLVPIISKIKPPSDINPRI